ncbi:ribosome small subunit-dependent GTPase A [Halanaerobiaceae bacterium Z-7014]|uniref:Small ribosomal subunit biogenesis GTPase RsgA n=1 Tax=Halonatronomonas betaini TaxID=2778430 RepID=A0A931AQ09_9FIRM|nr:ribosome small subunit-dependent GTPase A [Halonatronomonas betaini]MBF8436807.1 ribosome small subunit-dependent GTPase A [Halonatronomonas betaini]
MIGGFVFVHLDNGEEKRCKPRGRIREEMYPGDRVVVKEEMVEELLPREDLLMRPKVANVDQVLLVQSLKNPEVNFKLLDRFLILIESLDYSPVIVINKTDLVDEIDPEIDDAINAYKDAGYNVFLTSVKNGTGMIEVKDAISKGITVLAGPSGVGKTALLNTLIPGANLKVGDISKKLKRGTHTTREVRLLKMNSDGWIADTPGFSTLELDGIEAEDLKFYFPEFRKYLSNCKFNNCNHIHEPGCLIKEKVEEGELASSRYKSYKTYFEMLEERGKQYD